MVLGTRLFPFPQPIHRILPRPGQKQRNIQEQIQQSVLTIFEWVAGVNDKDNHDHADNERDQRSSREQAYTDH